MIFQTTNIELELDMLLGVAPEDSSKGVVRKQLLALFRKVRSEERNITLELVRAMTENEISRHFGYELGKEDCVKTSDILQLLEEMRGK